MPKTKTGEKITWNEFFKRWKKGIANITPMQRTKTQLNSTRIMLFGMLSGMIISFISFKSLWWLGLILLGTLINTLVQYLGLKKQLETFKEIEKNYERREEND